MPAPEDRDEVRLFARSTIVCRSVATKPHSYLESSARVGIDKLAVLHTVIRGTCAHRCIHVLTVPYTVEENVPAMKPYASRLIFCAATSSLVYTLRKAQRSKTLDMSPPKIDNLAFGSSLLAQVIAAELKNVEAPRNP